MKLTSKAFKQGEKIPVKYSCDGEDVSPPLEISGVPPKAESLVLIMDDPDVPDFIRKDRMFVHWIVFDLPPDITELEEGALPPGNFGRGTGGRLTYQGPCPPDRQHRYFFKLYALDCELDLAEGVSKKDVEKAMVGHILAQTELMATYDRQKKK